MRKFTQIPNAIIEHSELSPYDKIVYVVIAKHCFAGKTGCYPSISTIAKQCNCSDRTVQKSLKNLQKHGFIEVKTNGHPNKNVSTNFYKLGV